MKRGKKYLSKYHKKYAKTNKARLKVYIKDYREENKGSIKICKAKYYQKNKDKYQKRYQEQKEPKRLLKMIKEKMSSF